MAPTRGKGNGYKFLHGLLGTDNQECVLWPFTRLPKGYGMLGHNGLHWRAHRLMCQMTHGHPPTSKHVAAHSCNNPSCVNPNHLSWKTSTENHLDQRSAGTQHTNKYGPTGALEPAQVKMIQALKGVATQAAIAEQFGVSEETIRRIHIGVTYNKPPIDYSASAAKAAETKRRLKLVSNS